VGGVDEPTRVRRIRRERIRTPKAAPSAARGEAHGCAEQSHPLRQIGHGSTVGFFPFHPISLVVTRRGDKRVTKPRIPDPR
jgi:hypothetical protein